MGDGFFERASIRNLAAAKSAGAALAHGCIALDALPDERAGS